MSEAEIDSQLDQRYRNKGEAATQTNEQSVTVPVDNRGNGPSAGVLLTLAVVGLVLGAVGFLAGGSALFFSVSATSEASRALAKSETATSRAQVSEIYSKQLFTEMNRIGYPIRTPAEEHAPQPDSGLSQEPAK